MTPDHPVMLIHTSGHGVFVNQRAMTLVELDETTEDPEGGEIVRDENGRPTGMMREAGRTYSGSRTPVTRDGARRGSPKRRCGA